MALTQQKLQALQDKGLDKFFMTRKADWVKTAHGAYDYFDSTLPSAQHPRPDDVAGILVKIAEIDVALKDFLQSKSLTQKYWIAYFCDYIIEQVWDDIAKAKRGKT